MRGERKMVFCLSSTFTLMVVERLRDDGDNPKRDRVASYDGQEIQPIQSVMTHES